MATGSPGSGPRTATPRALHRPPLQEQQWGPSLADRVVEDSTVAVAAIFSEAAVTSPPAQQGRWLRI